MDVLRIAAFSDGNTGGNPAGVWIGDDLPTPEQMRRIAAGVGYSETAFAAPQGGGWRVRYFSPASEVPFCGHATIALGAALSARLGDGIFGLILNDARITVEGERSGELVTAALQSPPTRSQPVEGTELAQWLELFGYDPHELDLRLPPARIHGGADHVLLALRTRESLAAMRYEFSRGRELMDRHGLVTVMLAWSESPQLFHSRNAFASGGVYEDAATGAATAAFAGYLRDIGWPHGGAVDLLQGEDMGSRSRLRAEIPDEPGSSVRVSGTARVMDSTG